VRSSEDELIPTLRRHGIRIYAWSPAAAGFFSPTQLRHKSQSRLGDYVRKQYSKPGLERLLEQIHSIAEKEGVTGHDIAIRWLLHHSMLDGEKGDGIVIGARTAEQLEGTLGICAQGPLSEEVRALVDGCWEEVREEAPHFSPFAPREGEVLSE
jgi:aflatoxin B1 aldehyde reductase